MEFHKLEKLLDTPEVKKRLAEAIQEKNPAMAEAVERWTEATKETEQALKQLQKVEMELENALREGLRHRACVSNTDIQKPCVVVPSQA